MTRITPEGERNSLSVMKDIFMLYRMRDPAGNELASLIEMLGTHGSIASAPVLYDEDDDSEDEEADTNATQAVLIFTGELQSSSTL
ncbi:hypothetical protein [uncultured Methanomethylovorans sp.]|uniref:hypothetical protein n=1 Tax=uncultured Methanomethylovorans sp. TaxID=183759 RepID=UPI002AA88B46|nr:hypothetical protein [uncultured Methanomethylovorans sp.]